MYSGELFIVIQLAELALLPLAPISRGEGGVVLALYQGKVWANYRGKWPWGCGAPLSQSPPLAGTLSVKTELKREGNCLNALLVYKYADRE